MQCMMYYIDQECNKFSRCLPNFKLIYFKLKLILELGAIFPFTALCWFQTNLLLAALPL